MKPMRPELAAFFEELQRDDRFGLGEDVKLDDLNVTDCDGDNALHIAVVRNDVALARMLIEAGINIDQHGDLGYTPLHNACSSGYLEMVKLLVESGADIHARSEGESPISLAALSKRTDVLEYLRPLVTREPQDPHYWTKVKIDLLRREIARLEALIASTPPGSNDPASR